jgi:hypothetical protein
MAASNLQSQDPDRRRTFVPIDANRLVPAALDQIDRVLGYHREAFQYRSAKAADVELTFSGEPQLECEGTQRVLPRVLVLRHKPFASHLGEDAMNRGMRKPEAFRYFRQ